MALFETPFCPHYAGSPSNPFSRRFDEPLIAAGSMSAIAEPLSLSDLNPPSAAKNAFNDLLKIMDTFKSNLSPTQDIGAHIASAHLPFHVKSLDPMGGPVTYYVALPFVRSEDGDLVAGEAQDRQTASAAVREARRMALTSAGAVAFSRTGDPAIGEFDDAVVIQRFGDVPSVDDLLSGK